jgi:protein-S-isoprenylcysteine O-methyltransferase Ste14
MKMKLSDPLNAAFLVCFIAYVVIRGVYDNRSKDNPISERRSDPVERVLLGGVFIGSLLLPVVYLLTSLLSFADSSPPVSVRVGGLAVLLTALALFWRSHADLGTNWSVRLELRDAHRLVTNGVYRRVRHPMYASIFLFGIGQGMILSNWVAGWGALVTFTALYLRRLPREEQMMRDAFGEEYVRYSERTGRVFPGSGS